MFVRFRSAPRRLQLSLAETHRVTGRVRHQHIASLGALREPSELSDRIAYWNSLFDRMRRLDNRLDSAQQLSIFDAVNARVRMPTIEERREFGLANAETDARFWEMHADNCAATAAEHEQLAATVQHTIEQNKTAHSEAKANAETSRKRIARIKAGEEIGPQQPVDINRLMEETFGKRRLRYIRLLGLLSPEQFEEYIQAGRYHAALDSHRHTDLRKFIKNQPLDAFPPEKWVEIIELLYPNFVWPDHMMEEVE